MTYLYEPFDYSMFEARFKDYGRLSNFPTGLRALYSHLESFAEDMGQPLEIDVIGLCCEFTESSVADVLKEYDLETIDDLYDQTMVIPIDKRTVIYQDF